MNGSPPADIRPLLESLWPGADFTFRSGLPSNTYAVFPGWQDPRLLVPVDNLAGAARGMLDFSDSVPAGQAAKRLGAAALMRLGGARLARTRLTVTGGDAIEDRISEIMRQPVDVVIGFGTKRANRKPVMRILDPRGRHLAVAKLGTTPLTAELVRLEHAALDRLATRHFDDLLVPGLLGLFDWHGCPLLIMSALATRPAAPWRRPHAPVTQMRELAAAFAATPSTLPESPFLDRQLRRIQECGDPYVADLAGPVRLAAEAVAGQELAMGAWHGDFTSWNMSRLGDSVAVWDWEQFSVDTPRGLDEIHFSVNQWTSTRGMSETSVRQGLVHSTLNGSPKTVQALQVAYLTDIMIRYAVGFSHSNEPGLGRAAAVMREVLIRSGGRVR